MHNFILDTIVYKFGIGIQSLLEFKVKIQRGEYLICNGEYLESTQSLQIGFDYYPRYNSKRGSICPTNGGGKYCARYNG